MDELQMQKKVKELEQNIVKEVTYIFNLFVPHDMGDDRFDYLKRRIPPKDRDWIDFSQSPELEALSKKEFITPYDVLKIEITTHIKQFYNNIEYSIEARKQFNKYGEKAITFCEQFQEKCRHAEEYAIKAILQTLERAIMQKKSVQNIILALRSTIEKRTEAAQIMILENYRQMLQYMVLWEYQNQGYTRYKYITTNENCAECSALHGKIFSISEAKIEENLPPIHPNCDCHIEIVNENDEAVLVIEKDGFKSKTTDEDVVKWYTPLLRIPTDAKAMLNTAINAENIRLSNIDSPISFLDWMTYGLISANYNRYQVMLDDPSAYNILNWATLGSADMIKGAFFPEESLSLSHWLDSFGTVMLGYSAYTVTKNISSNNAVTVSNDVGNITVNNLDDFFSNPEQLGKATPEQYYNYFLKNGYNPQPLGSKSSLKGIPFEDGGGFRIIWGGDRYLQYHPSKSSHHNSAYWKISSGPTGALRFDLDGHPLP